MSAIIHPDRVPGVTPAGRRPLEPDADALARFRNGDIAALGSIFKSYGPGIHRLARRMMGNQADADDATQETFIRAFEQAPTFRGRCALFTWLYRLAVRHCLNLIKQRRRAAARSAPIDEPAVAHPSPHRSPADLLHAEEELTRADRLLAAMASSLAFMLPVATPPNALVDGTGYFTVGQMARAGFCMNLAGCAVLIACLYATSTASLAQR